MIVFGLFGTDLLYIYELKNQNTTNHIVLSELTFCLPDKHCLQKCIFLLHMTIEIKKKSRHDLVIFKLLGFFSF